MRVFWARRTISYLQRHLDTFSRWLSVFEREEFRGSIRDGDLIDVELKFPIEFFIEAVPVSLQASGRSIDSWKQQVAEQVRTVIPAGSWATEEPVSLTIFYFPDGRMTGDIDNIVKPIMDAMSPMIYVNDSQVDRVLAQKFESERFYTFSSSTSNAA